MDPIVSVDYEDLDSNGNERAVVTFLDGRVETYTSKDDLIRVQEQIEKQMKQINQTGQYP